MTTNYLVDTKNPTGYEAVALPLRMLALQLLLPVACVPYFLGALKASSEGWGHAVRSRLVSSIGCCVTVALVLLGSAWPSLYTVIAIPALPAPFIFGAMIIRPSLFHTRRKVHWYLNICVAASGLAWLLQVWWELR